MAVVVQFLSLPAIRFWALPPQSRCALSVRLLAAAFGVLPKPFSIFPEVSRNFPDEATHFCFRVGLLELPADTL